MLRYNSGPKFFFRRIPAWNRRLKKFRPEIWAFSSRFQADFLKFFLYSCIFYHNLLKFIQFSLLIVEIVLKWLKKVDFRRFSSGTYFLRKFRPEISSKLTDSLKFRPEIFSSPRNLDRLFQIPARNTPKLRPSARNSIDDMYDSQLTAEILASWFDLMNDDGAIFADFLINFII